MHLKNLTQQAKDNSYFRHVLATGGHTQVVIMSIPPGGEIGEEVHPDTDQILYLVEGSGQVILEGEPDDFSVGDLVLVTAGTRQPLRVPQASAPNHPRVGPCLHSASRPDHRAVVKHETQSLSTRAVSTSYEACR